MPFVKKDEPYASMTRLLRGWFGTTQLSKVLNVSDNTARSKIRNPGTLTINDLKAINRKGHVPAEELWEAISW